ALRRDGTDHAPPRHRVRPVRALVLGPVLHRSHRACRRSALSGRVDPACVRTARQAMGVHRMTETWTSARGIAVPDRVPARLGREYVERGPVPPRALPPLFREQVAAHPERPAVVDRDGTLDYATLDERARRVAAALTAAGVAAGDVVGVHLPGGWR